MLAIDAWTLAIILGVICLLQALALSMALVAARRRKLAIWGWAGFFSVATRDAERRAEEMRELLDELTTANRIVREREQLFRLTFDRSPLGAALVAPDGRFLRVNEALCTITGYGEAELLRRDVFAMVARGHRGLAVAQGRLLLAGEERVSLETRVARADGAQIWLRITAGAVNDDAGNPLHLLVQAEDVTARKSYEQHLRSIERQQQLVLRTIPEQFWLKDVQGRYVLVSDSLAQLYGLQPEALRGRTADEVFPAEQAAEIRANDARAIASGRRCDAEHLITDHAGALRCMATSRAPVYDDDSTLVGIVGIARDITARRTMQEQLQEREALLRSISDNLPDGLIFQMERRPDGGGSFRYLSAGVERLWGVSAEVAYADPEVLWSRWHPDDRPAFERAARLASLRRSIFEFEGRVCLPDGTTRWSYSRSTPHALPDGGVLRSGVELDITARKQTEADLQRRVEALQTLNEIGQALTSWTQLGEALAIVAALLRRLFRAGAVAVWDYDPATHTLGSLLLPGHDAPCARRELTLEQARISPPILERHAATMLLLAPDHPLLWCAAGDRSEAPRHTLLLGLRTRNTLVGLLCISAGEPERSFTPEDVALSQTAGSLLASALENARLFALATMNAADRERRRIARELHDSVSQALFAANRTTEVLPQLWELDPDAGRAALADLHRFTGAALAEMRALLLELRPRALIEAPLHEVLGVLLPTAAARGSANLKRAFQPAPPLEPEVQVALYRIAQEALNNASKHARASLVELRLAVAPPYTPGEAWAGTVALTICDNGRGFDPQSHQAGHFGLSTMRERAVEIDAAFAVVSRPGAGAMITVTWRGAATPKVEERTQ